MIYFSTLKTKYDISFNNWQTNSIRGVRGIAETPIFVSNPVDCLSGKGFRAFVSSLMRLILNKLGV